MHSNQLGSVLWKPRDSFSLRHERIYVGVFVKVYLWLLHLIVSVMGMMQEKTKTTVDSPFLHNRLIHGMLIILQPQDKKHKTKFIYFRMLMKLFNDHGTSKLMEVKLLHNIIKSINTKYSLSHS